MFKSESKIHFNKNEQRLRYMFHTRWSCSILKISPCIHLLNDDVIFECTSLTFDIIRFPMIVVYYRFFGDVINEFLKCGSKRFAQWVVFTDNFLQFSIFQITFDFCSIFLYLKEFQFVFQYYRFIYSLVLKYNQSDFQNEVSSFLQ